LCKTETKTEQLLSVNHVKNYINSEKYKWPEIFSLSEFACNA